MQHITKCIFLVSSEEFRTISHLQQYFRAGNRKNRNIVQEETQSFCLQKPSLPVTKVFAEELASSCFLGTTEE